jgi:hypothetical protein
VEDDYYGGSFTPVEVRELIQMIASAPGQYTIRSVIATGSGPDTSVNYSASASGGLISLMQTCPPGGTRTVGFNVPDGQHVQLFQSLAGGVTRVVSYALMP